MREFCVTVTQEVKVFIDEEKFTEEFMEEFSKYMYKFDSIKEHAEHIGQYFARFQCEYPEGYLNEETEMFNCEVLDTDVEVEEVL